MKISHSEAAGFTLCERKHYYAFGEKLQGIHTSEALTRGQLGHLLMEAFFREYQNSYDFDKALEVMGAKSSELLGKDLKNIKVIVYLLTVINGFLNYYKDQILQWKIIHVEKEFKIELKEFDYHFTPDLIVEIKGELVIVDHKFIYDFYSDDLIQMLPQIPRYIGGLRALGIPVQRGLYAFLRYRDIKQDGPGNRFDLRPCNPNEHRVQNSFKDLILTVEPIKRFREMGLENWHANVRRTADEKICERMCDFTALCVAELNGDSGNLIRELQYKESIYGY